MKGNVFVANPARRVIDERTGQVVGANVRTAEGAWGSFVGLMFKKELPAGHGLLFQPAKGIHTHFMRFPIDLIYLDKSNRVTKVRADMRPWRFDFTNAAGVIEMNAGTAREMDIQPGDQLRFEAIESQ
jgi:uncharacterized membrane protein (UPF0127 family)